MNVEFDSYATTYSDLLSDPIRDRFASNSRYFHERKWALIEDFLASQNAPLADSSWLDVGCGQGELLDFGRAYFARAAGCDPSAKMLESHLGKETYAQPSPTELPFPDESFDLVTAVCVYHHVHGVDRTLLTEAICRVLKPGGTFCIIEHNPWNPITREIVKRCPVDIDAELIGVGDAERILTSAGLNVIDRRFFLYLPQRLYRVASWIEHCLAKVPLGGQFALFGRKPMSRSSSFGMKEDTIAA